MGYKYDIFFSYRHSEGLRDWTTDIFLGDLTAAVREELNRKPDVFLDLEAVEPNEADVAKLVKTLGTGLAHSRCMVAVWSSTYFYSAWCKSEVQTFLTRRTEKTTWSPVIPFVIHGGNQFPPYAREMQATYLNEYATPYLRRNSARYAQFKEIIGKAARLVSDAICHAPMWNSDWVSVEWFDPTPIPEPKFQVPSLE